MKVLACTLLADGTSDRALKPILDWLLDLHCPDRPHSLEFAGYLPDHPKGLPARLSSAQTHFPCDIMFVHRDAEAGTAEARKDEIDGARRSLAQPEPRVVPVVPVRMTEAWLLVDEPAIRAAAGNPNGTMKLGLPARSKLESLKDPKEVLLDLLRTASGLSSARLRNFPAEARRHRVTELMSSFEPLRSLPSFIGLESDLQRAIRSANEGGKR